MKKIQGIFAGIMLLLSCTMAVTALADTQSTTIRYSVPATVIYKGQDGTGIIQSIKVGETMKAPVPEHRKGYTFVGWINQSTGLFWDFHDPVTENLTLVAYYVKNEESNESEKEKEKTPAANEKNNTRTPAEAASVSTSESQNLTATVRNVPKTADTSGITQNSILLLLSGAALMGLFIRRRNKNPL